MEGESSASIYVHPVSCTCVEVGLGEVGVWEVGLGEWVLGKWGRWCLGLGGGAGGVGAWEAGLGEVGLRRQGWGRWCLGGGWGGGAWEVGLGRGAGEVVLGRGAGEVGLGRRGWGRWCQGDWAGEVGLEEAGLEEVGWKRRGSERQGWGRWSSPMTMVAPGSLLSTISGDCVCVWGDCPGLPRLPVVSSFSGSRHDCDRDRHDRDRVGGAPYTC